MKSISKVIIITSLSVASMASAQNYGNPSQQGYNQRYSQQGYQPGYSSQGYNQPGREGGYQDGNYGNQGYSQNANEKNEQSSSWTGWMGGGEDKNQKVPDDFIRSSVMQNLRSTPYFSPGARHARVEVKEGKVTLKGKVSNKNEKNQIEYMVKNVAGVKSVSNDLETEK